MSSPNYMMVTVASCVPSYLEEAFKHLGTLTAELKQDAGAATTRYGVLATGQHTGHLVLFQTYEELNGIDAAFGVYQSSAAYKSIIGSGKIAVTFRNILKIEDLGLQKPSTDVPAYGVVTRWGCADLQLDNMRKEVHHFEDNGAMILRYCTIMTGDAAGRRTLTVGYPSMDSIEKTYEALRGSAGYNALIQSFDMDWRNIIRIAG